MFTFYIIKLLFQAYILLILRAFNLFILTHLIYKTEITKSALLQNKTISVTKSIMKIKS